MSKSPNLKYKIEKDGNEIYRVKIKQSFSQDIFRSYTYLRQCFSFYILATYAPIAEFDTYEGAIKALIRYADSKKADQNKKQIITINIGEL